MTQTIQELTGQTLNYVEDTEASFAALLRTLNQTPSWRDIYGAPSVRLKDQELILRFLALKEGLAGYKRPLRGFLDRFMAKHKSLTQDQQETFTKDFCSVIDQIHGALGKRAFRPETTLNAAVFDAVMIGVFRRINTGAIRQVSTLVGQYDALIKNEQFQSAFKRSTADETQLGNRVRIATYYFSKVV